MKFLADQDVYQATVIFLQCHGYDIITARSIGLDKASDYEILRKAKELQRIILTRDKDFGALVFLNKELSSGVILLRDLVLDIDSVHRELELMLRNNDKSKFYRSFCVVESDKYRIRSLPTL
ncbi:MAG: DUF5615 family PIN-like protein [Candidatus Omnitrophica bacterium]|nr:DUF5615 family PIN-like protein [Candidatus Omnitrophota bacterium]